jgi:hypothetical protein
MFHLEHELETCQEQQLFFQIFELENFILTCRSTASLGYMEIDLTPHLNSIRKCILQTRRFGVEIDEPEDGKPVTLSKSYSAWYSYWENYFKNLKEDDDDFKKFIDGIVLNKDMSNFRPKDTWKKHV